MAPYFTQRMVLVVVHSPPHQHPKHFAFSGSGVSALASNGGWHFHLEYAKSRKRLRHAAPYRASASLAKMTPQVLLRNKGAQEIGFSEQPAFFFFLVTLCPIIAEKSSAILEIANFSASARFARAVEGKRDGGSRRQQGVPFFATATGTRAYLVGGPASKCLCGRR